MYICNNQKNITCNVYFDNFKNRNYQYKWICVKLDYTFFTYVKKARWVSEAQVGPLCEDKVLVVWGLIQRNWIFTVLPTSCSMVCWHRWCAICLHNFVASPNFSPTSVLSSRLWTNVSSTSIALWVISLCGGLTVWVTHTTEPTHYWAARLCAAQWCVAGLVVCNSVKFSRGSHVIQFIE